jgi:hypothetical protein
MSDAERQAARRQRVKEAEITIERARTAVWEAVIRAARLQESLKWGQPWKIELDADRLSHAVRTIHDILFPTHAEGVTGSRASGGSSPPDICSRTVSTSIQGAPSTHLRLCDLG